jgi:hypothetical protein
VQNYSWGSPCLGPDGTVYAGSYDHKLYAIKDGQKQWEFDAGSAIMCSSPCLGPDGNVYVGNIGGQLHAVAPPKMLALKDSMKETGTPVKQVGPGKVEDEDEWLMIDDVKLRKNTLALQARTMDSLTSDLSR